MYLVHGLDQSLFTRKLEAALDFYGVAHERRAAGSLTPSEAQQRAGTHQIPVLETPEGWALADTTPIFDVMDMRHPRRHLFPGGPMGVLTHILEDFFDEWVSRTVIHHRWNYPENASYAALLIADGDEDLAQQVTGWGGRACRALGMTSDTQKRAAEEEFERILGAVELQLSRTRFLLGDRPTAVDCALLGVLRAHIMHDPQSARVMSRFTTTAEWALTCQWSGGPLMAFDRPNGFVKRVLPMITDAYGPFLTGTRNALAQGAKSFTARVYGENVEYLTRPYPARAAAMVGDRIAHRLTRQDRDAVEAWLISTKLAELYKPQATPAG